MRRSMMTLALCSALAWPGAARADEAFSDGAVRIGVMTDLSGSFSGNTGTGSVLAARMAVEDFGSRVLGRPVEVVVADHGNKPDVASAKAREWFDRDGVDVVAELINSSVALAVMKVAADKGRVAMVLGSGSTRITNEDCTATSVHWAYDSAAIARTLARALVDLGGRRWFFLTADYAFGHSAERDTAAVVTGLGGRVVGAARHPIGSADFASYLLQAQGSGAQVVALANGGADTVNAVKQAGEFGVTPAQSLVGLTMVINDVDGLGLAAAQGLYLAEAWYWDRDPDSRAFAQRYFARERRMPNMTQAGMYSAVTHYLRAVEAAGTDKAATVMARMREMPVDDMFVRGGRLRPDGLMVHDMMLLQVKAPAESRAPWDYLAVRKVVPAAEAYAPLAESRCPLVKQP